MTHFRKAKLPGEMLDTFLDVSRKVIHHINDKIKINEDLLQWKKCIRGRTEG
jgi:hypothetical protein